MQNCKHNLDPTLCRDCQIEAIQAKKQFKRGPIKALKNRSRAQELEIGKEYRAAGFKKARKVPFSGAITDLKGDVDPGELFLAEAKLTRTGQLVIETKWLEKIRQEALDKGRNGWYALHAWIANGNEHYHKVVVVDEELFYKLLQGYKYAEE